MGKVVGIDLGTTFSAIATLDDRGLPVTLPNNDGEMFTPSAVLLLGNRAIVGQAALDAAQEDPEHVAMLVKRRMGLPDYGRTIEGKSFRPETLSAIILRKLVQDAEKRLGPISKAVITVPAYFDDTRRKATQDAGKIAGLDVLDILDEPSGAALSYSFREGYTPNVSVGNPGQITDKSRIILVYDLGGGTFDVTLVKLLPKRFQTLGIEGDVRLGGKDWDDRVVDYVAGKFYEKYKDDPRTDPQSLVMLQAAAERAKRTLSKLEQTSITCNHGGHKIVVPFTRKDFENLTRDLLTRTRLTTQQLLRQVGVKWEQIDRILLVGGSTHMPMTGQMLQEISGKAPDNTLSVSEVVARGAAIHAGIIAARTQENRQLLNQTAADLLGDVVEISVNALGLGVEVRSEAERINDILIKKNTQLPAAESRVYHTVKPNQNRVRVRILQGEAHQADACISIGECWIDGLPPQLPKGSPIQVRCAVAENGIIEVMALDMTSGRMAKTSIHRSSGLSDEEIAQEANWVKNLDIQ